MLLLEAADSLPRPPSCRCCWLPASAVLRMRNVPINTTRTLTHFTVNRLCTDVSSCLVTFPRYFQGFVAMPRPRYIVLVISEVNMTQMSTQVS